MICGSLSDWVVDTQVLEGWLCWFKEGDRFFHDFNPRSLGEQLLDFWQSVCPQSLIQLSLGLG